MEMLCQALRRTMMMMLMFMVLLLSCFLLEADFVQACTCLPKHPQQHYCDSDYAIRVKIFKQKLKLPNGQRYEINDPEIPDLPIEVLSQSHREWSGVIQKVYKGFEKLKHTTTVNIYSPFYDSMCGVGTLMNDESYVIMGTFGHGGLNFDFCDWHHSWKTVTSKQRRGLKYWYAENCSCQIDTCGLRHPCGEAQPEASPTGCEWDAWHSRCTNQHTACVMTAQGCQWHQSKDLKQCLKAP
ncbi:metalloproteinase inhibitor 3 [Strongylocentrotus purpuratus]|uniref:NTR domain-containing protein n=1 Tax=Strongylocentrotus purpuratus TaxID=7668 RepID=A0A7M7TGA0_STRPU|nr:metalloproteinase inhibitor 3 [Strongylocentrotus purpuratus]|eukprot:XP_781027.1 PREDICTED: metalloproteinase inhibitor 3 [Strongylocentrotus purpuratus]